MPHVGKSKQRGLSLVEVSFAILLIGVIAVSVAQFQRDQANADIDRAAGGHATLIKLGVQRYLDDFRAELLAGAAIGGVANTLQPTMDELRAIGSLGQSVGNVGPTGLTYTIRIDRLPAACVPAVSCTDVQALIWSSQWLAPDGVNPQRDRLGAIAAAVGIDAALPNPSNGAQLVGQDGIWPMANPIAANPQGIVALRAGFGSSVNLDALLPRSGARPMVGNLNMNNNDINNIRTANATDVNVTNQVSAATLTAPVGNITTVNSTTLNNAGAASTGTLNVTGLLSGATATFTGDVGAATVTTTGDITVGGALTATGNIATGGALQLNTAVTEGAACAGNLVSRTAGNLLVTCQGGFWRRAGTPTAAEGDGCATEGVTATAQDDSATMVCRGGRYIKVPALFPTLIATSAQVVGHNGSIAKPNCGAFGSAFAVPVPAAIATPDSAFAVLVGDAGATWTVSIVDGAGNAAGTAPEAIVLVGCRI